MATSGIDLAKTRLSRNRVMRERGEERDGRIKLVHSLDNGITIFIKMVSA